MPPELDYRIEGDDFQALVVRLQPGETVRAEPGAMMFMERGVEMDTSTGGGLMAGLKRKIAGESFFITTYTNAGSRPAQVGFASEHPGKILVADLARGDLFCQRDAYLASASGIDVDIAFTRRLGAGFFGGEGFVLQRLHGRGTAFLHAGGMVLERELAAGEELLVDTGCIVGFEASVDYDIRMMRGIKTMLFGGEGLFHVLLRGPGKCWIQTTPFSRFADRVMAAARGSAGQHRRGGRLLGGLLQGE